MLEVNSQQVYNLNTSHVKVQHIADILGRAEELDLNTSHVKVQRPHKDVYKELNG